MPPKILLIFILFLGFFQLISAHANHNLGIENPLPRPKRKNRSDIKISDDIKIQYASDIQHDSHSTHDHKKENYNDEINNRAGDYNHSHDTLHKDNIDHDHDMIIGMIIHRLQKFFSYYSDNKLILVGLGVSIISAPSVPIFLLLSIIAKVMRPNGSTNQIINMKILKLMVCFACGSILGDVFLHILPHLSEEAVIQKYIALKEGNSDYNHIYMMTYATILIGLLIFYTIDRLFVCNHHHHDHEHEFTPSNTDKDIDRNKNKKELRNVNNTNNLNVSKKNTNQSSNQQKNSVFVYLLADFMHNLVDGIALGVAFSISIKVGISTLVAEFLHEIPHEIGDFAILIKKGYSISTVLATQMMTAFGALIGGMIGIYIGDLGDFLIGLTAGGFLYLALCNMIPEILELTKKYDFIDILIEVCCMGSGIYLMYIIAITEQVFLNKIK